jgi:hypothetical protein
MPLDFVRAQGFQFKTMSYLLRLSVNYFYFFCNVDLCHVELSQESAEAGAREGRGIKPRSSELRSRNA